MKIAHIFKIVDAVYAVDRENLRQADACIVHGIPPLFAKMYLIFTIQEIGEKEKTEKIKIDSDCANMESKKYTRNNKMERILRIQKGGAKMSKKPVLVVMAAGMGSRYGGLKQIDPVDEYGNIIMDFSIYDAVEAGFEKVVFIIKKAIEKEFMEHIGKRMEKRLASRFQKTV